MGIWLIYYGISNAHLNEYLDWFEGQHTDEKLARPGYNWASHHEVVSGGMPNHADHVFIAMFGAANSRVFYDPSPAQIKPHQDELTRTMIGYRVKPMAAIMSLEWSELPVTPVNSSTISAESLASICDTPVIRLGIFDSSVDDQDTCAWCAQTHFPAIAKSKHLIAGHKFIASFGSTRHIVLEQHAKTPESAGAWDAIDDSKLLATPLLANLRHRK